MLALIPPRYGPPLSCLTNPVTTRVGASPALPLGPGHDHIGLPSAAAGTDKPRAPIEDAGVGAVPSSHLCRVRLDLMLARLAPHDKPDLGRGGGAFGATSKLTALARNPVGDVLQPPAYVHF